MPYTFTVIDNEEVNAFAHVGGYIYVHTGLLRAMPTDQQLTFVLAHETAHIDLRHCARSMTARLRVAQAAGEQVGDLAQVAYQAVAMGYAEELEFEADDWAYSTTRKMGYPHTDAMAGLLALRASVPPEQHDAPPAAAETKEAAIQEMENHFRTHPPVNQRIARQDARRSESVALSDRLTATRLAAAR